MRLPEDDKLRAFIIDKLVPFPKILEANGYEGYSYEGKCFCPMHENENTPSAKLYHDVKGDTLWCFSEQKRYKPSDIYKKGLARKGSIASVAESLWKQLSEDVQESILSEYGKPVDYKPEHWEENRAELEKFKSGKRTYEEHMALVCSII